MSQKRIKSLKKLFRMNMGGLTAKALKPQFKQFVSDMKGVTYGQILLQIKGE